MLFIVSALEMGKPRNPAASSGEALRMTVKGNWRCGYAPNHCADIAPT